tara:strand:+ start:23822 stop:24913 length:1092 start_codon:yes stop_codon:yes gene_type:complete
MNTRIFCRIKENDHTLKIKKISNEITSITIPHKKKDYEFNVNQIWSNSINSEIFNDIQQYSKYKTNYLIHFGFTGTGKTYTTLGILNELLRYYQTNIIISAIQIYNNDIYDLITNNKLKYFKTDKLVIKNKSEYSILDERDIHSFITLFKTNRSKSKTNFNHLSSRSHAIIYIKTPEKNFVIVDMAGQESGVQYKEKKIQNEGTNINLNMLALKECIRAIHNKNKFIPFRRTLLTFTLKNMFSGNHFLAFICTISAQQSLYNQIDSLKYSNQLFECSKDKLEFNYDEFVEDYNKYINETGWYNCEEIKIYQQMKKNNFNNVNKIQKYMQKKLFWLQKFKNVLIQYQKINPELKYEATSPITEY